MEKNVLYMIIGGAVLFAVGVFVGKSLSHPYGFRGGMHRADCPFAMNAPVVNPCNCGMMGCGCAQPNAPVNIAPDCNCGQVPPAPRREPEPRMKGGRNRCLCRNLNNFLFQNLKAAFYLKPLVFLYHENYRLNYQLYLRCIFQHLLQFSTIFM